ncbi:MAG TPA: glycosyltransferase [Gemmatimonadales bacterium]
MTIRVVHVASGREWRGGQRQVWLLARELARLGAVEQVVVTGRRTELAERLARDGVPVRGVVWTAGLDPRVIPAILSEARSNGVVLHAHDAHATTLAGAASWLTGTPFITTRRVDFPLRHPAMWKRARKVIAISSAVADVLVAAGIPPDRIVIIPSGISVDEARATEPLGIRHRLGLAPDAMLAVNVASLVGHKDHATLMRAAGALRETFPTLHWVVAGEGPLRGEIERLTKDLSLTGCVHLLGHIPDPVGLIADADVFVMSSSQEGLGTSVLDAMARGIPVASTAAGGLPDLLSDGGGLLVPPGDFVALAEAVQRILNDSALRSALITRAHVAVQRFTSRRMAEESVSVYRSCASFP